MTFLFIFTELAVGLILLFAMTKLLGKTQLSQVTPFDFISALVLGELVGNAIYDREIGLLQICFAVFVWGVLLYIIEKLELKVLGWRGFLEGNPSIIVRNGMADRKELNKNKMTINQLQNMLREKDIFSIREVQFAILEANGSLSVMKKPVYDQPTRQDLQLPISTASLPVTFIIDGTVLEDNLRQYGYDVRWLEKQLDALGYANAKDVFIAEWDETAGMHVVPMPAEQS